MSDETEKPCHLCGGRIGPDITGRPMCYGCGPPDMMPREERDRLSPAELDKREHEWSPLWRAP